MLRISVQNGPLTTRFKLEGKLAHEWVSEAAKAWSALTAINGQKKVIVDLFDVEFVDDLGTQLLAQMNHAGAELVGSGPMISALIEEIEGNELLQTCEEKELEQ
jgi:anti-anti-sigma regulatory factor